MHISGAFSLEDYLSILKLLIKDHTEHETLIDVMSLPTMIGAKIRILSSVSLGLVDKA